MGVGGGGWGLVNEYVNEEKQRLKLALCAGSLAENNGILCNRVGTQAFTDLFAFI